MGLRLCTITLFACLILAVSFSSSGEETRFIDNGDGTITDTKTNLMWASHDNMGDITWHKAKSYCEHPPVGYAYANWRMPTVEAVSYTHLTLPTN